MRISIRISIQVLLGLSFTWGLAYSRTWEIKVDSSGDAPSIQAGIDSSAAGDTVMVFPGTFEEALDFLGKDITVKSVAGASSTIIDAGSIGGFVVTFQSGESRLAIIEGFTITKGNAGVLIFNSEPSILSNVITENSGNFSGGGIWAAGEPFHQVPTYRPLIQRNTITRNTADRIGGGIGTWQRMAPEILDNYIAENVATEGDGGGIYFRALPDDDGAVIRGNVIEKNYAGDHGGGFYAGSALSNGTLDFEFSWNLVSGNIADGLEGTGNSGGGVWLWETSAWVHHNTIVDNTGNGPTNEYGGGIVVERSGSPLIEKNIIALSKGGGVWCGGGATPILRNNLAWQNGGDGVRDCTTWWESNGNIVADPHFCNSQAQEYTLSSSSAAITHIAGPLGALPIPGCGPVPVRATTWGSLKSKYRSNP